MRHTPTRPVPAKTQPDAMIVKLGDVADIVSGITLGRPLRGQATRRVPYLRVANVKDRWLDLSDVYEIEATEAEIEKCRLRYGDILLTEGGDADKLGRRMYWEEQLPLCLHQNHIFRVRLPSDAFCPEYTAFQFGSPYGKAYFAAHAKQTTGIATINRRVLENFPLVRPPLANQRRIAARLREQLAEVAQARAAVQAQLAAAQAIPAATLRQVFEGVVGRQWERVPLKELVAGPLRTEISKPTDPNSAVRCLTLSSVRNGELNTDKSKPAAITAMELEKYRIRPGVFYVVRGNGNRSLVARGALAPASAVPVAFPDLLIEVVPDESSLLPVYFRFAWDAPEVRRDIDDRVRTAAGIYKINLRNLSEVAVPLPGLTEQRTIAGRLAEEIAEARKLQESLNEKLVAINRLPAALLAQAFPYSDGADWQAVLAGTTFRQTLA